MNAQTGRVRRSLLGLLSGFPLPIVGGAFPLAVVPALILVPTRAIRQRPKLVGALLVLSTTSILALAMSALANRTPLPMESIAFLASATLFVWVGTGATTGERTAAELLAWTSAGTLAYTVIIGNRLTEQNVENLWKYGVAFQTVVILLWLAARSPSRTVALSTMALVAGAALSLFSSFRSFAAICLITLAILLVKRRGRKAHKGSLWSLVAFLFIILASYLAVTTSIDSGLFGEDIRLKNDSQLNSGGLFAGRTEVPLSVAAISARPVVGWGTINSIDWVTISAGQQLASKFGLADPSSYIPIWIREDGNISVHSQIFKAWIEGGVFAAAYPLALLLVLVAAVVLTRGRYSAVVTLASTKAIWDLLFSPWGEGKAVLLAATIVLCIWAIRDRYRNDEELEYAMPLHHDGRGAVAQRRESDFATGHDLSPTMEKN